MTPPDGGWGWMVVLAALLASAIADGVTLSFGLLFPYLSQTFSASSAATAWIGSLFMSVPLLSGPLCSALVDRFGCRSMTMLGGVMAGAGFAASSILTSLPLMYLTFGLLSGLGLGLIYVTAVVSIAYWFDKKRTLATSLGAAGTGIGTFLYAPLTDYLLTEYGWRGTVLLLGGNLLNMSVCGALMREPDGWGDSICGEPPPELATVTEEIPACQSLVTLPTYLEGKEKLPPELLESLLGKEGYEAVIKKHPGLLNGATGAGGGGGGAGDSMGRSPLVSRGHHLRHVRVHRNSVMYRGALLKLGKYKLEASSCPDIFRTSITSITKEREDWKSEIADIISTMMDFSLFSELHFLLFSASTILLFTWFVVPYFYLVELMKGHGYTETQASAMLSVIGVTNTIGMVALGWFGDRPWLNVIKTYSGCLIGTGLSTCLMTPAAPYPAALILAASGFGLFVASNFSFTPTILVEIIPLDDFTTAYGLTLLCQGVGALIGPPLAAGIFDTFGSWELSFYVSGAWIVVAGLLMAIVPFCQNKKFCTKPSSPTSSCRPPASPSRSLRSLDTCSI